MRFAEALQEVQSEQSGSCKVDQFLTAKGDDFRDDHDVYVANIRSGKPGHTVSELWRILRRAGLRCCRATVDRHFRDDCPCHV